MKCPDQYLNAFTEAESAYENNEMDKAISLFLTLADLGVVDACIYLGLIYKTGDGVPIDKKESQIWYSKYVFLINKIFAEGNVEAALTLAKMYQYGDILEKNESKAIDLMKTAAKAGSAEAHFHLAMQYLHGWCGCSKSALDYHRWLEDAVKLRYPEALYMKGLDLFKNKSTKEQGRSLIGQSADLGFWVAKDWLGRYCNNV